ncbi:uncharacterized protein G2W53_024806 [Senna tora]|uniref:Uncharacterized protein n=1 Tax=Senna tora TaxID=362788 RepID=A0A834WH99_9FABA|nr:uncharacterized protein G2W53_024806 [Senna tora]
MIEITIPLSRCIISAVSFIKFQQADTWHYNLLKRCVFILLLLHRDTNFASPIGIDPSQTAVCPCKFVSIGKGSKWVTKYGAEKPPIRMRWVTLKFSQSEMMMTSYPSLLMNVLLYINRPFEMKSPLLLPPPMDINVFEHLTPYATIQGKLCSGNGKHLHFHFLL